MQRIACLLAFCLLSLLLSCSSAPKTPSKRGGELVIGMASPLNGLDPAVVDHILSHAIAFQLFDGLLQYRPGDFKLVPALAEAWNSPDGGWTWIFQLRRGVRFNNDACFPSGLGREVVASDFNYSLERIIRWRENDSTWKIFGDIEGAEDFRSGQADHIRGISVLDPYTLEIRLTRRSFSFLHRLANIKGSVVPKEAVEAYGARFREHPVGTGPFRLATWDPAHSVYLVRNPSYWEIDSSGVRLPYLDALRVPLGAVTARPPDVATFLQFEGKHMALLGTVAESQANLIRAYNLQRNDGDTIRIYSTPVANTFFLAFRMDAGTPLGQKQTPSPGRRLWGQLGDHSGRRQARSGTR